MTELRANKLIETVRKSVSMHKLARCYRVSHMTVQMEIGRNGKSFRKKENTHVHNANGFHNIADHLEFVTFQITNFSF